MARTGKKEEGETAPAAATPNVFTETSPWMEFVWGKLGEHAVSRGMELPRVRWQAGFTEHGKSAKSTMSASLIFGTATVDGHIEGIVRWTAGFDVNPGVVIEMAKMMAQAIRDSPARDQKTRGIADRLGFEIGEGGLRKPIIGRPLRKVLDNIAEQAGPFPHRGIKFDVLNEKKHKVMTGAKPPQKGRMLKVECLEQGCGLIIRQSGGTIKDYGVAWCPRHQKPMTVIYKEGEEPDETAPETPADQDNTKPQVAAE